MEAKEIKEEMEYWLQVLALGQEVIDAVEKLNEKSGKSIVDLALAAVPHPEAAEVFESAIDYTKESQDAMMLILQRSYDIARIVYGRVSYIKDNFDGELE